MNGNLILIEVDRTCAMARVSLNNEIVMEGNYNDFYPGCHGITKYGNFNNHLELSTKIYQYLIRDCKIPYLNIKTIQQQYEWGE